MNEVLEVNKAVIVELDPSACTVVSLQLEPNRDKKSRFSVRFRFIVSCLSESFDVAAGIALPYSIR